MILAVNVNDTEVGGGLGRARTMAVAEIDNDEIRSWTPIEVGWDVLHDAPAPGRTPLTTDAAATPVTDVPGDTPAPGSPVDSGSTHSHAHGAGHGAHHARIVRFLKDNHVDVVVTGHAGPPMLHTLELMGVACVIGAAGDARQAAIQAYDLVNQS
ncbi:MAG: hypothetical protein LBV06_09900 [Propionibacteriaceae bacterium]|nr:hypothetical protein [Propionibacteriaceae bacterium]